jgi:lipoprotein-anchoring transpeptidase ErfK/SrfK
MNARFFLLVTLVCIAGWMLWPDGQKPAAAPQPTLDAKSAELLKHVPATAPGTRIWYAANAYPHLAMPGGREEIVRSALNIKGPMHFGSFIWDETRVPKQGSLWVRVDLEHQILSVFRGGHEIGSAVILYGTDGKPTPTGDFTILQKAADYHSHSYDAAMPYMLRLTDDGVAIHGSNVRQGYATHGCIGVPLDFAKRLFAVMAKGDPVFILPAQIRQG